MNTKTLHNLSYTPTQLEADLTSLRRLLVAASISPDYCCSLLSNPSRSVNAGYGGERFILSEPVMRILSNIRAKSLNEFIQLLNEKIPILPA